MPTSIEFKENSINNTITATNITSGLVIVPEEEKTASYKSNLKIQVIELRENGAIFELPKNSCSFGHKISFTISIKRNSSVYSFTVLTKIITIEPNETSIQVSAQLISYKEEDWNLFLAIYSNRQDEINKFFQEVKN
jgi:hypothetical protein